jgi:hypothetical protein
MRYPWTVIVKGKVYGSASTLAEAQKVAKAQGGFVLHEPNKATVEPTKKQLIGDSVTKLLGGKEEARQSFIAYCVEHAGLTPEEAAAVGAKYKKGKAIDFRTDGRFYVTHGGLLEPELLRFHAGWATDHARVANPDLLTGKIRQREDGGHYVRTRKDKRPAEVDVTADQVAGDWRTQLAHSGHAPTPKPPKAPKGRPAKPRAPKAIAVPQPVVTHAKITEADFFALITPKIKKMVAEMWAQLQTKRDAIGFCAALCEDVNFREAKLPSPDFRDTPTSVESIAKKLDWDIGATGAFCWLLLSTAGAMPERAEVQRATLSEMRVFAGLEMRPEIKPVATPMLPRDERLRHKYAAQNGFQVVIDTDTKFEAVGPNGMLKIKAQPGFGNGFIAHLFSSKGRPLEYGSSGFDGTMDEALANLH